MGYVYCFTAGGRSYGIVTVESEPGGLHEAELTSILDSMELETAPEPDSTPVPNAIFREDFSGDGGYLGVYEADDGYSEYVDGVYRMTVTGDLSYIHGSTSNQELGTESRVLLHDPDLAVRVVDVDATFVQGAPSGRFGVACGFRTGRRSTRS